MTIKFLQIQVLFLAPKLAMLSHGGVVLQLLVSCLPQIFLMACEQQILDTGTHGKMVFI
jgi:hypothetical protein